MRDFDHSIEGVLKLRDVEQKWKSVANISLHSMDFVEGFLVRIEDEGIKS